MAKGPFKPRPTDQLQIVIGYTFKNPRLLTEAITHPSHSSEVYSDIPHNQRLEFFGDAVIQILITERLFHQFPDLAEGDLTRTRAILTRQPSLAALARHIELGEYLRMGKGETQNGGNTRPSNLCDAFEALIAAIYIDAGQELTPVRTILSSLLDQVFPHLEDLLAKDNPKGTLQEFAQRTHNTKPTYEQTSVIGPDHDRIFTVNVLIGEEIYGTGEGPKRQKAEKQAATAALKRLQDEGHQP